ncbi:hypothetical protein AMTRI_Chr13g82830 [Amborella trichopoda]
MQVLKVFAGELHSIVPIGCLSLLNVMGLMPLSKTKCLASDAIFYLPILRQVAAWAGLVPATKKKFIKYLEAGYSCIVIPGGIHEKFIWSMILRSVLIPCHVQDLDISETLSSFVVYLKKRHGFVCVAMETGHPLVPVFCFCFGQFLVNNFPRTHIPYCRPMHVIVRRPIELKRNPNPSDEEVAKVHATFVSKLEQLFQRHKVAAGYVDIKLKDI